MKNKYLIISGFVASFAIGILMNSAFAQKNVSNAKEKKETKKVNKMKLGRFL